MLSITKSPGTVASVAIAPYDDKSWSNVNNVNASDDAYASTSYLRNNTEYTAILKCTNCSLNVPSEATIVGVEMSVEAKYTGNSPEYSFCKLTKDGSSFAGDNLAVNSVLLTSDTIKIFGSPSTLWGLSLSPSDVNSGNFGVGIAFVGAGASFSKFTPYVDHVQITAYYTEKTGIGLFTRVGGAIKECQDGYVKVGGVWKPVEKVLKKSGGVWRE